MFIVLLEARYPELTIADCHAYGGLPQSSKVSVCYSRKRDLWPSSFRHH